MNLDILVKLDRASMHSSLEARSPLLSNYIFEKIWKLDDDFKVNKNKGKLILKSIADEIYPKNFLNRPKIGFGIPIGDYLRSILNEWACDLIYSKVLQYDDYLDHQFVKKIWNEHNLKEKDWSFLLWNIINYLSWKTKIFNEQY